MKKSISVYKFRWLRNGKVCSVFADNLTSNCAHRSCSVSAVNLPSDCVHRFCSGSADNVIRSCFYRFCWQYVVRLCFTDSADSLLTGYVLQTLSPKQKLNADTDGYGFDMEIWSNLLPICCQPANIWFTGLAVYKVSLSWKEALHKFWLYN